LSSTKLAKWSSLSQLVNEMSIDLFCYVSVPTIDVQATIDLMEEKHAGLFKHKFLISKVCDTGDVQKEIAKEFGLDANCRFLVSLNDKSATDLLPTVESLIKNLFGNDNVIILLQNETLR